MSELLALAAFHLWHQDLLHEKKKKTVEPPKAIARPTESRPSVPCGPPPTGPDPKASMTLRNCDE